METVNEEEWETFLGILEPVLSELQSTDVRSISNQTADWYQKQYGLISGRIDIENGIDIQDVICQTTSKNSYYARIAAVRHVVLVNIHKIYKEALARDRCDPDDCYLLSATEKVKIYLSEWGEIQALIGKCHLSVKTSRQSKRKALSGLPVDWRERLYLRMSTSKYVLPLLLASVTGCRPSELVQGVHLTIGSVNEESVLLIKITGAKVTSDSGQPERILQFPIKNCPFLLELLIAETTDAGGHLDIAIQSAKAFSTAITRAAKTLWPSHKHDITAYCLRHAASADMKSSLPPHQVAAALGHVSERTQRFYGQKQQSRSTQKMAPEVVTCSREIRPASNSAHLLNKDAMSSGCDYEP